MRILLIVLIIILIHLMKPGLIYKSTGKPREFGVGRGDDNYKKTLFTLPVIITMLAIVVSYQVI